MSEEQPIVKVQGADHFMMRCVTRGGRVAERSDGSIWVAAARAKHHAAVVLMVDQTGDGPLSASVTNSVESIISATQDKIARLLRTTPKSLCWVTRDSEGYFDMVYFERTQKTGCASVKDLSFAPLRGAWGAPARTVHAFAQTFDKSAFACLIDLQARGLALMPGLKFA